MMNDKDCAPVLTLPFTDFRVNMYNYTTLNRLKETRLILKKDQKKRDETHKIEDSNEIAHGMIKQSNEQSKPKNDANK